MQSDGCIRNNRKQRDYRRADGQCCCVSLIRIMISGAIATIGVTWSRMAYGKKLISITRLCTKTKAINVPIATAIPNAFKVTLSVLQSASNNSHRCSIRDLPMAAGDGNK